MATGGPPGEAPSHRTVPLAGVGRVWGVSSTPLPSGTPVAHTAGWCVREPEGPSGNMTNKTPVRGAQECCAEQRPGSCWEVCLWGKKQLGEQHLPSWQALSPQTGQRVNPRSAPGDPRSS